MIAPLLLCVDPGSCTQTAVEYLYESPGHVRVNGVAYWVRDVRFDIATNRVVVALEVVFKGSFE